MGIAIHRKFIAVIATTAVLITGVSASQVQAGEHDTERALAALLGLAVIGAIIADNKKDDDRYRERVTRHDPVIRTDRVQRRDRVIRRDPQIIEPRPLPRRVSKRALPSKCLRTLRTQRGDRQVLGARCVQRNYRHVNRLPSNCRRSVGTRDGVRNFWSTRCLSKNGFRVTGY
jgi:hypothetical protein